MYDNINLNEEGSNRAKTIKEPNIWIMSCRRCRSNPLAAVNEFFCKAFTNIMLKKFLISVTNLKIYGENKEKP